MIQICSIASGSNGNCYYIGTEKEAIIIDAGIFYKQLNERMLEAGLDKNLIKAAFISHGHADHVKGMNVISKKINIPGFFSQKTYYKTNKKYRSQEFVFFKAEETVSIGEIKVYPFSKKHDCVNPHSFRVEVRGKSIGVMTDIGVVDQTLQDEFAKCDAVFLEANYDKQMLWKGDYPYFLKERVDSEIGHLSNEQAVDLVENFASPKLHTIFLSHISARNNTHEKVMLAFEHLDEKYNIILTSRHTFSQVIEL